MSHSGQQQQMAVAGDGETSCDLSVMAKPPYLKLIIDCWEHIFDYLPFKDIYVMGETCKQMHQFAGYYIREFHPELEFNLIKGEIRFAHPADFVVRPDFYQFITKLHVKHDTDLNFFANINTFDSLKMLIIGQQKISETEVGHMRNVLKNIETFQLVHCRLPGNVFEHLAKCCGNLQFLHIHNCSIFEVNNLFAQHYPMLKQLQYRPLVVHTRIEQLQPFLEKHSKLVHFAACYHFLWENRDLLMQTNMQLDVLNVQFDSKDPMPFREFVTLLQSLHGRGFYKTLKLTFRFCKPSNIENDALSNAIATLPSLRKLVIPDDSFIDLNRLGNLKEVYIEFLRSDVIDTENLARTLPKLERLGLGWGFMVVDAVLPFVRYSKQLQSIVCPYFADKTLDLFALNQERMTLTDACEIEIRVPEDVYINQKWKSRNIKSNLVKIARFELNYDFCFNF